MNSSNYEQLRKVYKYNTGKSPIEPENVQTYIKVCRRILGVWGLSESEMLYVLGLDSTDAQEVGLKSINNDLCFRCSLVLGIYADLKRCFIQEKHQLEWLQKDNKSLEDGSPISLIRSGDIYRLADVRVLLSGYLI